MTKKGGSRSATTELSGTTQLKNLRGVGPAMEVKLARLGAFVLRDLLLHLPLRYEDRTRYVPLNLMRPGTPALFHGEIVDAKVVFGRRRSLVITLTDSSGYMQLRFFHFSRRQQDELLPGVTLKCFGEPRFTGTNIEIAHPEYRIVHGDLPEPDGVLTPVYPTTEGLGQARLRKLIDQALDVGWDGFELPGYTPSMSDAITTLHRPSPDSTATEMEQAQQRLATDELLAHHLLMKERQVVRLRERTKALPQAKGLGKALLKRLGFELTDAQKRCLRELFNDLDRDQPMMRLVQGDVGSGKTILAAFAAIRAAEHDAQTAIMAPTEILAEQLYINFSEWLSPLGIEVCLLTGRLSAAERRTRLAQIAEGNVAVVIGTHALFQQSVTFGNLALAVIDEQHRFGVHQRMALKHKGRLPHQLIMTATPIPRTLTMAIYADLDISVIDELPKGRQPIQTRMLPDSRRDEVIEWLRPRLHKGDQVYWVCNLIDPSEDPKLNCVTDLFADLDKALPGVAKALLHGRLPSAEKSGAMSAFKAADTRLLVATTVIEVGVDVPNASVIVIENSERLGLAQLHQLRGRVGRGSRKSYCVLLHTEKLGEFGQKRLEAMVASQDGFFIAEKDLELRGPGDVLGTRQTGEAQFRVADLMRDALLLPGIGTLGDELLEKDPESARAILNTWATPDWGYGSV